MYKWFNIAFDSYGRTSTPKHTEITQSIFLGLQENGFIKEKTLEQTYCEKAAASWPTATCAAPARTAATRKRGATSARTAASCWTLWS